MTRFAILFGILSFISLLAFNNCSGGFKMENPAGVSASSSSQCRTKVINAAKSQALPDASVCENPANYQCDLRRFRMAVGHERTSEQQCSNIAGMGEVCINVIIYNFDTSEQSKSAEASEVFEDGAYNRDEAVCINTQVTTQGILVVQGEGSSVTEALEKSIESCRQRNRP
jgi:hypothetical protein